MTGSAVAVRLHPCPTIYAYVEVAFGPLVGFLTGILVWLSCVLAAASVASALATSVALAAPAFGSPIPRTIGIGLVFATFGWLNIRGVAVGSRLVEVVTVAKLLPLVALTAAGLLWVKPEHLIIEWASPDRVGTASVSLLFAFFGIEVALAPSGEIRDPARTVPRAVFIALGLTTLIELRRRNVRSGGRPFQHPGGPVVPALACLVVLWLLSHAAAQEFAVTSGAVAVAALLYARRGQRTPLPLVEPA